MLLGGSPMVRDFVQVRICGHLDKQGRVVVPEGLEQYFRTSFRGAARLVHAQVPLLAPCLRR